MHKVSEVEIIDLQGEDEDIDEGPLPETLVEQGLLHPKTEQSQEQDRITTNGVQSQTVATEEPEQDEVMDEVEKDTTQNEDARDVATEEPSHPHLVETQLLPSTIQPSFEDTSPEQHHRSEPLSSPLAPDSPFAKGVTPEPSPIGPEIEETPTKDPGADNKLENQLLTPMPSQLTQDVSQTTPFLVEPMQEDYDLPTPCLTQSTSAGIVPDVTPQPPRKDHLVERLRELRSLSAQKKPSRRSSNMSNAVKPWFTPQRSSQTIPDSQSEAEVESVSDESDQHSSAGEHGPAVRRSKVTPSPEGVSQTTPFRPQDPATPSSGLRSSFAYYTRLCSLPSHYSSITSTIVIAVAAHPVARATAGPKDYYQSIYITDPSASPDLTTVSIFRHNKAAFPIPETGDAILLRNFKVQSQNKKCMLLSTDSSAWAVMTKAKMAQVRGPPVEYGAEERGVAKGLRDWWESLGDKGRAECESKIPAFKEKKKSMAKNNRKETENELEKGGHQLRGGRTYGLPEEERLKNGVDNVKETTEDLNEKDDGKEDKGRSRERSVSLKHELRDGTTYNDPIVERTEGKNESADVHMHSLRDGRTYHDRA